jgi:hypothetical protein
MSALYSESDFDLPLGSAENLWLPLSDLDLSNLETVDLTRSVAKLVYQTDSGAKRLLVRLVPSVATDPEGKTSLLVSPTIPTELGKLIDRQESYFPVSLVYDLTINSWHDSGHTVRAPEKDYRLKVTRAGRVVLPEDQHDIESCPILLKPITATNLGVGLRIDRKLSSDLLATSGLRIRLFKDNDTLAIDTIAGPLNSMVVRDSHYYRFNLPATQTIQQLDLEAARLVPYTLTLELIDGPTSALRSVLGTTGIWVITPSIAQAITELRSSIQKSRLQYVIKALDYSDADLLYYLQQGLSMFNAFPPTITSFNGLNMQGAIRTNWIYASQIYALMAQFMAENDMNFELSGQQVSLTIDRKSGIESQLGRLQEQLTTVLRPFKQLLVKSGVIGGDGSSTGVSGGRSQGTLTVGNHALLNPAFWSPTNQQQRLRRMLGY